MMGQLSVTPSIADRHCAVMMPLCPTEVRAGFRLVKVSQQGRRYYFSGAVDKIEAVDVLTGQTCQRVVSRGGLLPGDAQIFDSLEDARDTGRGLNLWGIGGAQWTVERADV